MIGVLDSGIGGLSIYREIKRKFPDKVVIYFSDNANFPYGEKTDEQLLAIVRSAIKRLVEMGANIVVLACNSATVATVRTIRSEFDIPIVGIEPAVKQAGLATKTGKVGILATKRTLLDHEVEGLAPGCELIRSHNGSLIARIEQDITGITDQDLRIAIEPFCAAGVDSVVLGCTHYHFVKDRLQELYPNILFFAPDTEVVNRVEAVISEKNIELAPGNDIYLCSADRDRFGKSLSNLLGIRNADIRKV